MLRPESYMLWEDPTYLGIRRKVKTPRGWSHLTSVVTLYGRVQAGVGTIYTGIRTVTIH